jgi:hypothetical protein
MAQADARVGVTRASYADCATTGLVRKTSTHMRLGAPGRAKSGFEQKIGVQASGYLRAGCVAARMAGDMS